MTTTDTRTPGELSDADLDAFVRKWQGTPVVLWHDGEGCPIEGYEIGVVRTREFLRAAIKLAADRALAARPAPASVEATPMEDPITVPRGLVGAACAAIARKADAPKVLAELRRYTTGDLSSAASTPVAPASVEALRDEAKRAVDDALGRRAKAALDPMLLGRASDARIEAHAAIDRLAAASTPPAEALPVAFDALRALTEALLTRADEWYLWRLVDAAVKVMADHGCTPPVPWPDLEWGIARWGMPATGAPAAATTWQDRLKAEHAELVERVKKLSRFLDAQFDQLPAEDGALLAAQLAIMGGYLAILDVRCTRADAAAPAAPTQEAQ